MKSPIGPARSAQRACLAVARSAKAGLCHDRFEDDPVMTVEDWLESAVRDAERRGLPALRPLLEGLARSTTMLRSADWNIDLSGTTAPRPRPNAH